MSVRAFVDTNVVVYAFDDDEPEKQATARAILDSTGPTTLVLSAQVLAEFYVTVTRKLARPVPPDQARAAVEALRELPVVSTDSQLVQAAVVTAQRHQLSLWDAMIVEAAAAADCDVVLTEDLTDGAVLRDITIENPFAGRSPTA